ncbi:MAG TPA: hypothetical protein VK506_09520 [Conexibacter sp.]|nr:hypothetical protein [Conexibacter sp.]
MAVATKVALALLLVSSVLLAFFGPPPRRQVAVRVRGMILLAGLFGYGIAATALASGSLIGGALVLALAGELICAAGWLGRGEAPGSDDDGDDGGGGGGGRRPKPPPPDWDAFELAFRRYARERERQRV